MPHGREGTTEPGRNLDTVSWSLAGPAAGPIGGDSGIGRAIAIAYAREGADVLIAYLSENDDANEVKVLIEKEGRKAILISGDLASSDHCRAVIKKAVDELGGTDILVNNAAHQATFKDIGDARRPIPCPVIRPARQ